MTNRYGYEKLTGAEAQVFHAQDGTVEFAVVWLLTRKEVFQVSIIKGEEPEALAAAYRKRGYTDDRAVFFGSR